MAAIVADALTVMPAGKITMTAARAGWKHWNTIVALLRNEAVTKGAMRQLRRGFRPTVQGLQAGRLGATAWLTEQLSDPMLDGFEALVPGMATASALETYLSDCF